MSNLTIRPQEPRRPRFPFFHLHNVKERTSGASFEGDVSGSRASKISGTRRRFRLPGSTSALSEIAAAGPQSPRRSALAGYMADPFGCQHRKMTKPTKNDAPVLSTPDPRQSGSFELPHRPRTCGNLTPRSQEAPHPYATLLLPLSETCRNWQRPLHQRMLARASASGCRRAGAQGKAGQGIGFSTADPQSRSCPGGL